MTSVTSHAHTNGIAPVVRKPVQVKFLISDDSPGQYINIHLTIQSHALILFVTSTDSFGGADVSANDQAADATGGRLASLGSFVFAMPNVRSPVIDHATYSRVYKMHNCSSYLNRTARQAQLLLLPPT